MYGKLSLNKYVKHDCTLRVPVPNFMTNVILKVHTCDAMLQVQKTQI